MHTSTEDGDDLLLELRGFLSRMGNGAAAATDPRTSAGSSSFRPQYGRDTASALRLLRHLPASRHAVLEYLAGVIDVSVAHHLIRYISRDGFQHIGSFYVKHPCRGVIHSQSM